MTTSYTIIGLTAALLSACGGHPYTESSLFDGAVSVCTDNRLEADSVGTIDWSQAASPRLEDLTAMIEPRAGKIVQSNTHPAGPIGEKVDIPFCHENIPANAEPYTSVGSSKLDMTEEQMEVYKKWTASKRKTPFRATEKLYVVNGVVRHINVMAIKRYVPPSESQQ